MIEPFERPLLGRLVHHKTNPDILFVAYSFNKDLWTYKCRHVGSNPAHPLLEQEFHHYELDMVDSKTQYRRWDEFEIVYHRTNSNIKMITLANLPENGKTKCRWINTDETGLTSINECIFEDFELIFPNQQ